MKNRCLLVITLFAFSAPIYGQVIKAYFTQSVNNSVSPITDAKNSAHLEDTIVALIDNTNTILDMAVWDNGSTKIVTALNNAYNRGVQVRYITSSNALNSALSGLNGNIPVLERNSGISSNVMHNKFILSDNSTLLTGSMNFGLGSMEDDYNNIVIIQNASLVAAYSTEFNEMWGSAGAQPNTTNSKFGIDKTDNTTHNFTVGATPVELYFSPTDNTTMNIVNAINTANNTLDVATFTFTHNDLGDAVIAAHNNGVSVRVIIENESYLGSEFNGLTSAGVSTISHQSVPFDFHHKYAIIDASATASDPMVITGSHNWTNSAEDEYDENTLIIHDAVIAGQYLEEFTQRYNELTGNSIEESGISFSFYQESTGNYLAINSSSTEIKGCLIYDLSGRVVMQTNLQPGFNVIPVSTLSNSVYLITLTDKSGDFYTKKWIKN